MTAWKTWLPPPSAILRGHGTGPPSVETGRFWGVKLNSPWMAERTQRCRQWYCLAVPSTPGVLITGRTSGFERLLWQPTHPLTERSAVSVHRRVYLRWNDTWIASPRW